jgi:hypothetical protein
MKNSNDKKLELVYGDFLESFVWLSMDHSKDNFRNNYIIFKSYYFIFFLKNYFLFLLTFLITIFIL